MGIFTDAYQQQNGGEPQSSGGIFQQAQQAQLGTLPRPAIGQNGTIVGGYAGNAMSEAFGSGVQQAKEGVGQIQQANQSGNTLQGLEGGVKAVAGGVGALLSPLAPIFGIVGKGANAISDKISNVPAVQGFAQSGVGKTTARVAEDVGNVSTLAGAGVGAATIEPGKLVNSIKDTASSVKNDITDSMNAKNTAKATAKIQDTISPKPTVKEAKLAQSQGRFVQGKERTLFKAGTADSITPSPKVVKATETIQRNIPGADTMNESQLHDALQAKITETAQNLKPVMKATPIKPEIIQKINDDWTALKKTQMQEADATDEPNVRKQQAQFEARLQKSGNSNMNDLWETRKTYDDSVPENVKKANSMSSDSLQSKKQIWLQNRDVLTNAINDTESGMGEASQKPMSDMHDMYNAKEGIISKTRVDTAKMSKVNQFLKAHPKLSAALGGASIYEIAKHIGVPLP